MDLSPGFGRRAISIEEPLDTAYGDRRAMVRDPFGNLFQIAHRNHPAPPRPNRRSTERGVGGADTPAPPVKPLRKSILSLASVPAFRVRCALEQRDRLCHGTVRGGAVAGL